MSSEPLFGWMIKFWRWAAVTGTQHCGWPTCWWIVKTLRRGSSAKLTFYIFSNNSSRVCCWNGRKERRAQCLKEWHGHRTWQRLVRTNWIQDGRRVNFRWTLSLITLTVTDQHKLGDMPTSSMTVLRSAIKYQNVGTGPIPRNPHPFPKITGIILPHISLWNDPAHKN